MKNTLWTFGCSFTAEWWPLDNDPPNNYDLYKKWKGGTLPPVWPTILSEKLGMELQNKGEGATGNDKIFMQFCNSSHLIKEGDIVIVGWTHILRFMMASMDNKLLINILPNTPSDQHDNRVMDYITVNRDFTIWYLQIVSYIKMIINYCNSVGARVYFWTSDYNMYEHIKKHINPKHSSKFMHDGYRDIFSCISDKYIHLIENGLQIIDETNGEVTDFHLGELGHQLQADLIYNHILNSEKNI